MGEQFSWRTSGAETRRHEAMAPYVVEEREAFCRGRELTVPVRQPVAPVSRETEL